MRDEIERRLRCVDDIKYEPTLIEGRESEIPPKYFDNSEFSSPYLQIITVPLLITMNGHTSLSSLLCGHVYEGSMSL